MVSLGHQIRSSILTIARYVKQSQNKKGQRKQGKGVDIDNGGRHEVEVRYYDGVGIKDGCQISTAVQESEQ